MASQRSAWNPANELIHVHQASFVDVLKRVRLRIRTSPFDRGQIVAGETFGVGHGYAQDARSRQASGGPP